MMTPDIRAAAEARARALVSHEDIAFKRHWLAKVHGIHMHLVQEFGEDQGTWEEYHEIADAVVPREP
jgi:hypothetical protein